MGGPDDIKMQDMGLCLPSLPLFHAFGRARQEATTCTRHGTNALIGKEQPERERPDMTASADFQVSRHLFECPLTLGFLVLQPSDVFLDLLHLHSGRTCSWPFAGI